MDLDIPSCKPEKKNNDATRMPGGVVFMLLIIQRVLATFYSSCYNLHLCLKSNRADTVRPV